MEDDFEKLVAEIERDLKRLKEEHDAEKHDEKERFKRLAEARAQAKANKKRK